MAIWFCTADYQLGQAFNEWLSLYIDLLGTFRE